MTEHWKSSLAKNVERFLSKKNPALEMVQVFQEIREIDDPKAKIALLTHQLRSIAKEHFHKPWHSYAMEISHDDSSSLSLHDPLYLHTNVLERCQRAIEVAVGDVKDRYEVETVQIIEVLRLLHEELPTTPYVLIKNAAERLDNGIGRKLKDQGWKVCNNLITKEVSDQFNVAQNETVLAGQKYLYIMPQSKAHKGSKSMYLLAQPVYIPSSNTWLLLQDQHMFNPSWEQHLRFINKLVQTPLPGKKSLFETWVMTHIIEFRDLYQTRPLQETLKQLLYEEHSDIFGTFTDTTDSLEQLLESIELHSSYLVDILAMDDTWEATWSKKKAQRLDQALANTLSTLMQNKLVTPRMTNAWLRVYYETYSNPFSRSQPKAQTNAFRLGSISIAPHLSNAVSSSGECVFFSSSAVENTSSQSSSSASSGSSADRGSVKEEHKPRPVHNKDEYVPVVLAEGEIWYIKKKYAHLYTASNCRIRKSDGVMIGPCDIPLLIDDLCRSELEYLGYSTRDTRYQLDLLKDTLLFGAKTQQEEESILKMLSILEKNLKKSVSITEAINNDYVEQEVYLLIHSLSSASNPLVLIKNPQFLQRVATLSDASYFNSGTLLEKDDRQELLLQVLPSLEKYSVTNATAQRNDHFRAA